MKHTPVYRYRVERESTLRVADNVCGTAEQATEMLRACDFVASDHEEIWAVFLDGQNRAVGAARISQGGMHGAAILPRDVLRPALLTPRCAAIVLGHNHPSGDPTPSRDDIELTRHLAEACRIVGVRLLDHLVLTDTEHRSLREMGVFET